MSNESSSKMMEAGKDWGVDHRERYLSSGGTWGHVMDLTFVGGYPFSTNCMIKYTGRKSGKTYIIPLVYGQIGGEVIIIGSKGGADHHPAWYLNILEAPEIEFQIATQAFRATWRSPVGEERKKIWNFMVAVFPPYAKYQAGTDREIPIVAMKLIEQIEPFKVSDVTA